jgi:putative endopeptidase
MIEQFNAHEFCGEKVNGELTQGENIADLGGVAVSFVAFQKWMASHSDYNEVKGSAFTPNQRFFLSYAQVWRTMIRDEAAKQLLVIDPHSPGLWRVNGILNNSPEFHAAFDVKEGDAMFLDESKRVKIW